MKLKLIFSFLFVLITSAMLIGCLNSNSPGKYDSFAQCLTEKGAVMYGTEWCPHCKNQKKAFSGSFQYISYVDCDKEKDECLRNGIRGYPTWIINREKYPGEQKLDHLAYLTECELTEDVLE